ncbi:ankyrin-1-like [Trichogramma pretiosum]|uniref:ankyrin-1-like n=1 Tax=Trichogramma pretiosum TaxID=7493 RepID=UPI0006C97FBB|nr:ankyrin-1-like [Trichogramma pretiosum]
MEAIIHKNDTILKCLIEAGAQVNYANSKGLTPLLVACNTGNIVALNNLLSHNAVADARTIEGNLGALHFLTASKFRQPYKMSSLIFCYYAQKLYQAGANIDGQDSEGQTPLHYAMKTNDFEIFKLYIDLKATTSFLTSDNNTMLHELMVDSGQLTNDQEQMAEILLNEGANINAVNDKSEGPLHCAIVSGRRKKVEFLLKHGADHDRWWSNSLGSALHLDNDWSVGCDRSATCSATHHPDELTLLNSAIKLGKVEVVEYLIQYLGFEEVERPNRIDSHDAVKTPLFYALPSVEIVQILLDAGANCKREVLHESSLFDLAVQQGFKESLALLLEHGAINEAMYCEGYLPLQCSLRLSRESTRRSQLLVQLNLRIYTITLDSLEQLAHDEKAPWLTMFSHECQNELNRMREYRFSNDTSCSVYRIFTLRDIDSSLEVDLTSRDIEWVFYEHERRNRYPIYADMLGKRFEFIRERQIARAKGIYVLNVYLEPIIQQLTSMNNRLPEPIAQQLILEKCRLPKPILNAIIRNFSNTDINWSYEHLKPL